MSKPRNLSEALRNGYIFSGIYHSSKGLVGVSDDSDEKIRVYLKPRFFHAGMAAMLSFWIDRKYFERTLMIVINNNSTTTKTKHYEKDFFNNNSTTTKTKHYEKDFFK